MTDGVVLITTSPIPSHPSTAIIKQTIASVRARTDWPIVIVADGVRPEQEHRRADYQEYLSALQAGLNDDPVMWLTYSTVWRHQAGTVSVALQTIPFDPELLLMVEHDTPLVGDWPMDQLCHQLLYGEANVVRSYHEKELHPAHEAMLVREPGAEVWMTETLGTQVAHLCKTRQWSQRPHLARTDYYRRILTDYFPPQARSMVEDRMHGLAESAPWEDHKIWLWLPQGNYPDGTGLGTQRSEHLDGRSTDKKWQSDFGFTR